MKVGYKGEKCELLQEIGQTLVVVLYHGVSTLVKREAVTAPGDKTEETKPKRSARKAGK